MNKFQPTAEDFFSFALSVLGMLILIGLAAMCRS